MCASNVSGASGHNPASGARAARDIWLLVILGAVWCLWGCGRAYQPKGAQQDATRQKISIGIQTSPAMAVPMVAKDLGFFERRDVDVELKEFTAGKLALQAMLGGSVDLAVVGDVPVVLAAMHGNDLRVLTQLVRSTNNEVRIVARRDGDTSDPSRYFTMSRRKLATSLGGGPEFFTWSYMRHIGIPLSSVEIVGQKPEDMPAALISGSVDAIAIFDPFAFIAEKQMGQAGITFVGTGVYSELYVLAARPAWATSRIAETSRIVKALDDAAAEIRTDPLVAQQVVMKYTHLDADVVAGIWKNFDFSPSLTAQLIQDWHDEVTWARETGNLESNAQEPDFRHIIDDHALQAVSPQSISY